MLVFDNTTLFHPDDDGNSYWSNLINYDKAKNQFIMELGRSNQKTNQKDSVKVLMSVDEIECMQKYNAIKHAYTYAKAVSIGKVPIWLQFYLSLDNDKVICKNNIEVEFIDQCDIRDYINLMSSLSSSDEHCIVFEPSEDGSPEVAVISYIIARNDYDKEIYELEDKLVQRAIDDCNDKLIKMNERNI